MSSKQKVLILDVDGTLTNSQKVISEKTLQALLEMQERGHIIMIASGRPTHGVKWISDVLKLEQYGGYVLNFNGARIMNVKTKEIVYQQKFPRECIEKLYDYCVKNDIGLVTYENEKVITGTRFDSYMEAEATLNHMELVKVDNFVDYVDFDVNKCLMTAPVDIAEKHEKELAKMFEGVLSIYRSEPYFIEAMSLGVDKAASLSHLFEIVGINVEDTVACGDGFNDMSMIEFAGVGVAMANAQEAVKKAADIVTKKTNDEDGLLEVIETYFL